MNGVSRFDCYPSDFLNGVIGLTGDQIAAYTIVVMLQYDRGEPVAYVGRERELSVRSGLPRGRLSVAVAELLRIGKLEMSDGALFNGRTVSELKKINERIRKNAENSLNGGNTTKKKWEQIRNENREVEGRSASEEASQNTALLSPPSSLPPPIANDPPSPPTISEWGGEKFELFWEEFPKGPTASHPKALAAWLRLLPERRPQALAALPHFKASQAAKPTTHPLSPERYLLDMVFLNFAAKINGKANLSVRIERLSPDGDAWDAYYRAVKGKPPPWTNGAWTFPTHKPPPTNTTRSPIWDGSAS